MTKLHGIIPPVITPLASDITLDVAGLERLIEHILDGGVHGLFVLGSTGEGPALSEAVQQAMIRETCRITRHRVPVLAGISSSSSAMTSALAETARREGADAVVAAPPCYFSSGADELEVYYRKLTQDSKLPVLVYNMPSMTKVDILPSVLDRIVKNKQIVGYKDSSGNMCNFHEVLQHLGGRDDFSIFVGPEELLGEAVLFGADGGVAGGANLSPELFVKMYEAASAGRLPEVRKLQGRIYQQRRLYGFGRYQSSMIKGVKCALSLLGICNDVMAPPSECFGETERRKVEELLIALGRLPAKP